MSLFTYSDGKATIHADPARLHRALCREFGYQGDQLIAQVNAEDPAVSVPAQDRFLEVVRKVFALPPVDVTSGEGVRDAEVYVVFRRFTDYLEGVKKNTATPPSD